MGDAAVNTVVLVLVTAGMAGFVLGWSGYGLRRSGGGTTMCWGGSSGVLGSVYAIILGFMQYTVWNNFQLAKQNVGAEANSLVNLSRLSAGLPTAERARVRSATEQYATVMVRRSGRRWSGRSCRRSRTSW